MCCCLLIQHNKRNNSVFVLFSLLQIIPFLLSGIRIRWFVFSICITLGMNPSCQTRCITRLWQRSLFYLVLAFWHWFVEYKERCTREINHFSNSDDFHTEVFSLLSIIYSFVCFEFVSIESHILTSSSVYKDEYITYSGKTAAINSKYVQTKVCMRRVRSFVDG